MSSVETARRGRVVLAVALAGLSVSIGACGSDDDGTDEEPAPEQPAATLKLPGPRPGPAQESLTYLQEDGEPLMLMHTTATELAAAAEVATCEQAIDELNKEVTPSQAVGLSGGVADPPLQGVLIAERQALAPLLATCVDPEADPEDLAKFSGKLAEAVALVDQRLGELEAIE